MAKMSGEQMQTEVIQIVKDEKTKWEDAVAWITEDIGFKMRDLIKTLWRNYWGVFKTPNDSVTGRKKIFYPLTEIMVEHAVKTYDLDTKDVTVRSRSGNTVSLAKVIRGLLLTALGKIGFGEKLDVFERDLAIQGTAVWKTLEKMDKEEKRKTLQIVSPNLLNIYIDPTAPSIQEAYRFTERALLTPAEIKRMKWSNVDKVKATAGLSRNEANLGDFTSTNDKYVDVWEMWGAVPEYLFTGDSKDKDDIEAHVVVSGIESNNPVFHLIEKNLKGVRPYEEAWYQKVSGRWYGRGVAEKLIWMQLWINTIINIRITRSFVSQLGIFTIRRGSNITPQMLGRLAANGAIMVNSHDDITQMAMEEASSASYKDEENIFNISRQLTSVFEAITGETLPSDTSATAASVTSQGAQSQFSMIREGIGMFLSRWIKRQAMPILIKELKKGDVVRIVDDPDTLKELDEIFVDRLLIDEIVKANQNGRIVSPEQVLQEKEMALQKLAKMGSARYVKMMQSIDVFDYDVEIDVTNEKINKGVLMQNLLSALQMIQDPVAQHSVVKLLMDTMGVDINIGALPSPQQGQVPNTQNPQQINTKGNTLNG